MMKNKFFVLAISVALLILLNPLVNAAPENLRDAGAEVIITSLSPGIVCGDSANGMCVNLEIYLPEELEGEKNLDFAFDMSIMDPPRSNDEDTKLTCYNTFWDNTLNNYDVRWRTFDGKRCERVFPTFDLDIEEHGLGQRKDYQLFVPYYYLNISDSIGIVSTLLPSNADDAAKDTDKQREIELLGNKLHFAAIAQVSDNLNDESIKSQDVTFEILDDSTGEEYSVTLGSGETKEFGHYEIKIEKIEVFPEYHYYYPNKVTYRITDTDPLNSPYVDTISMVAALWRKGCVGAIALLNPEHTNREGIVIEADLAEFRQSTYVRGYGFNQKTGEFGVVGQPHRQFLAYAEKEKIEYEKNVLTIDEYMDGTMKKLRRDADADWKKICSPTWPYDRAASSYPWKTLTGDLGFREMLKSKESIAPSEVFFEVPQDQPAPFWQAATQFTNKKMTSSNFELMDCDEQQCSFSGRTTDWPYSQSLQFGLGVYTFYGKKDGETGNKWILSDTGEYIGFINYTIDFEKQPDLILSSKLVSTETGEPLTDGTGIMSELFTNEYVNKKKINLLGEDYYIVNAIAEGFGSSTPMARIELLGGEMQANLNSGETETYEVDGTTYEITADIYSDTAKFIVKYDGIVSVTDYLPSGETDKLPNGVEVGVQEVLTSSKPTVTDSVTFFIGARKIILEDNDYTLADYVNEVQLSGTNVEDVYVNIHATTERADKVEIDKIVISHAGKTKTQIAQGGEYVDPVFGAYKILGPVPSGDNVLVKAVKKN